VLGGGGNFGHGECMVVRGPRSSSSRSQFAEDVLSIITKCRFGTCLGPILDPSGCY